MKKNKLKFIIEKGIKEVDGTCTPIDLIDISRVEYPVSFYHQYKKVITNGIVTNENGALWCEADIPEKLHYLTGSIAFKKQGKKFELMGIGLIECRDNVDPTIKPIGHPQI